MQNHKEYWFSLKFSGACADKSYRVNRNKQGDPMNTSGLVSGIIVAIFLLLGCNDSGVPKPPNNSKESGESTSDPCNKAQNESENDECSDDAAPYSQEFKNLLNPDAKKDCDVNELVYDRQNRACLDARIDMSWCGDKESIIKYFNGQFNTGDSAAREIETQLEAGFGIDQCGDGDSGPVATFLKKFPEDVRIETAIVRIKRPE